jgi:hypothetical protein
MLVAHGPRLCPCPHALRSSRPRLWSVRSAVAMGRRRAKQTSARLRGRPSALPSPARPTRARCGTSAATAAARCGAPCCLTATLARPLFARQGLRVPQFGLSLVNAFAYGHALGVCCIQKLPIWSSTASTPDFVQHPATPHHAQSLRLHVCTVSPKQTVVAQAMRHTTHLCTAMGGAMAARRSTRAGGRFSTRIASALRPGTLAATATSARLAVPSARLCRLPCVLQSLL